MPRAWMMSYWAHDDECVRADTSILPTQFPLSSDGETESHREQQIKNVLDFDGGHMFRKPTKQVTSLDECFCRRIVLSAAVLPTRQRP